jgi:hypothetical protein
MGMNGMPPMPGFGGAPFFGGHQVQMPNGWMPGGDGGGPMRRGGGRFQNQRSGPYDRRPGGRSWNNQESGRLSPPGGRPGPRPGSTGGAPGPREAVAGRSLKSYEDLDAVAGNGGGELNY